MRCLHTMGLVAGMVLSLGCGAAVVATHGPHVVSWPDETALQRLKREEDLADVDALNADVFEGEQGEDEIGDLEAIDKVVNNTCEDW